MGKIVTRLYDSFERAEQAVLELERAGIAQGDISLVSHQSGVTGAPAAVREPRDMTASEASGAGVAAGATLGGLLGAGGGVLAGLGLIAIPGLGPVVAAGWLAAAALGAAAGGVVGGSAGGIVGALTNAGVSEEEADVYAEGVRRGGTLVSVNVSEEQAASVEAALDRFEHVELGRRREAYRSTGWTHFDEQAPVYSDDEAAAERESWMLRPWIDGAYPPIGRLRAVPKVFRNVLTDRFRHSGASFDGVAPCGACAVLFHSC